ncbi:MAG TPA: helix-turn-helix transcriptional regulator [Candidatus Saccharimonadales bacterium]|nr:helix-turn-helix transcriptional regulator [Candidatus Saccharimonadales bacterium]
MSERAPFITLGRHLKYVREQLQQSVPEVSGAVEIDEQTLEKIESGQERPSEDILLLLISHYGVQEQQAVQLWELAEYEDAAPEQIQSESAIPGGNKVVMLLAVDTRTMYSDGLNVAIDPAGVTLTFTQATSKSQVAPVARVGMSLAQAEQVSRTLQLALLQAKYGANKLLPPPKPSNN